VNTDFGKHPIINVIWAVLFGVWIALNQFIAGIVLCLTIVLIPIGLQAFKFAKLSFIPFGATIDKK
ncbi:MAG: YccF domain-containing protein, partial [Anaeroplasmataceae bacterium]